MNAKGRLDIAEVVFEAALHHLVMPVAAIGIAIPGILANPVQAQDSHGLEQGFVMGGYHATLSRRQILGCIKAERHGITLVTVIRIAGPNGPSSIIRSDSMSGIFNDEELVMTSQRPDGVHLTRQSSNMHGNHRACAPRDTFGNGYWIDVAIRANVGQHGQGAHLQDRVDRGTESQRAGDDLIARSNL